MGSHKDTYPNLKGEAARRAIARDRVADEAFDRREEARLKSELELSRKRHAERAERRRVKGLLTADRAERSREALREAAELEVREGVMVNLADTTVEPTKEWLAKGDVEAYVPAQHDSRTVRTVSTVRRIRTPVVTRMERKGQLSAEAAKACLHFAITYERAGLVGNISSVDIGREVFAAPNARSMFSTAQLEAQQELAEMRKALPSRLCKFFEAVTVQDLPIHRAAKYAQMRRSRALATFCELAESLAEMLRGSTRLA